MYNVLSGLGDLLAKKVHQKSKKIEAKDTTKTAAEKVAVSLEDVHKEINKSFRTNVLLFKRVKDVDGKMDVLSKKIDYVVKRLSPQVIKAKKEGSKDTKDIIFDPLGLHGNQLRQVNETGALSDVSKDFKKSAMMKVKNIGAKTIKETGEKSKPNKSFAAPETHTNKTELYNRLDTDQAVDNPTILFAKQTDKNFRKVFAQLDDITALISSSSGGGITDLIGTAADIASLRKGRGRGRAGKSKIGKRGRGFSKGAGAGRVGLGGASSTKAFKAGEAAGGAVKSVAGKMPVGALKALKGVGKMVGFLKRIPGIGLLASAASFFIIVQDAGEKLEAGLIDDTEYKKLIVGGIGDLLGGAGGAIILGGLGSILGPVGTIGGGILGAVGGGLAGKYIAEKLWDFFVDGKEVAAEKPKAAPTATPAVAMAPAALPPPAESVTKPIASTPAATPASSLVSTGTAAAPKDIAPSPQSAASAPVAAASAAPKTADTIGTVPSIAGGDKGTMDMIKKNEGVRYRPYKDSLGLWTIGVGHLIGDGKTLPPEYNREFSKEEVDAMFAKDFKYHQDAAEKIPGFFDLNTGGQAALTDMTFNMGPSWYKRWKNFTSALEVGDEDRAADNLVASKWYGQVGKRAVTNVALVRNGGEGESGNEGVGAGSSLPESDKSAVSSSVGSPPTTPSLASTATPTAPSATPTAPSAPPTPVAPTQSTNGQAIAQQSSELADNRMAAMAPQPVIMPISGGGGGGGGCKFQPQPPANLPDVSIDNAEKSIMASFNASKWASV